MTCLHASVAKKRRCKIRIVNFKETEQGIGRGVFSCYRWRLVEARNICMNEHVFVALTVHRLATYVPCSRYKLYPTAQYGTFSCLQA